MKTNKWRSGEWVYDAFIHLTLLLKVVVCVGPFLNVLSKSLSADWAIIAGKVTLLPQGFTLSNMKYVATNPHFLSAFKISLLITIVGTLASLLLTVVTAYPLSKRDLPGVNVLVLLFVITMLFSGGLIPTYLLVKQLGMLNHLSSLVVPGLVNVFNLLLIKNYYESLPESLEESARIDGASNMRIIFRIVLPLSAPVIATISLFYAVAYWSDWFQAMIYINTPALKPLQLYLRDIVLEATSDPLDATRNLDQLLNLSPEGIRNATVILSTVPILLVYPFLQKHFIKGILIGSVKG
ncbi:carbohydrate ABC transporter permease [Paenibacillus cymbidii]|uniref:carbohydrate ABC transporter permease n=1 Tax=Paenibacillus cymbidii TaxID=1639034 RepID=UPI001080D41B|nr:carbohydrate ABC transporter permease [Paenibacillus cymbidii]